MPIISNFPGGGSAQGFKPTSIKIVSSPSTTQYYAGDVFVSDGMTIEVAYENGATRETTAYLWEPSGPLEYGTDSIRVIFSENGRTVFTDYPITVIREEVAVPYQASHLTYNKSPQTANIIGYDQSKMTVIDGATEKTNAGTYSATFRLSSVRYEWTDTHTTEDRKVEWTIDRFTIQKVPSADDLEYNERQQSPVWKDYDPEQLEIGGQTEGIESNTYTATFTPIQPNYQWEGGDISAKEVEWKIVDPITIVTVPHMSGTLTYDGTTKKPVWINFDQEHTDISGDEEGIDAGEYTATFTLHEKCEWSTGGSEPKKIVWEIQKATGTLSVIPTTVTLDNDHTSVEVAVNTNSDGRISAVSHDTSIATASVHGNTVTISAVEKKEPYLAGDIPVGETVIIKENGVDVKFLVVHQGLPSDIYDESCNGTWLLREDCVEQRQWNDQNVNDYENSAINAWLNDTYSTYFDGKFGSAIKNVKIPYHHGNGSNTTPVNSGANGLSTKIFLLSGYEVGFTTSVNQYFPVDGAKLDYFENGIGASARSKRIANLEGDSTMYWWLRSPFLGDTTSTWVVDSVGNCGAYNAKTYTWGTRPCFIIPQNFDFNAADGDDTVDISTLEPGSIVQFNEGGQLVDFYVAAHDYEVELNGAGRTLVVRKDCYDGLRAWNSAGMNLYASSSIDTWLNDDYKSLLGSDVQSAMGTTKFYYTLGNGNTTVTTLDRSVFLLSATELGQTNTSLNAEGAALSIASTLKITYLHGEAVAQWTRSPVTTLTRNAWYLVSDGDFSGGSVDVDRGVRPAFTVPANYQVPKSFIITTTTVTISVSEGTNWTKPSDASVAVNAEFAPTRKALSDYAEGDIVKLNENGVPVEFYIAKHNYESDLNGAGRTLVVRKDCYDQRVWNGIDYNIYANSAINTWLNDDYKNRLDSDVQSAMGTTKFYYTLGGGFSNLNTLEQSVFLLSATELGQTNTYLNAEGTALSSTVLNLLKIAHTVAATVTQWTRSPTLNSGTAAWHLDTNGFLGNATCSSSFPGSRPAFTLPAAAQFDPETNEYVGINTLSLERAQRVLEVSHLNSDLMGQEKIIAQQNAYADYLSMMTGIDLPNEEPEQPVMDDLESPTENEKTEEGDNDE